MARFTNYGSKRKEVSERASRADRERDPVGRRGPVHERHAPVRDVRKLLTRARSPAAGRRAGDDGRRPARPPDPPGAFSDLELAYHPPGLRPRRADRRRRHHRGTRAERRAGANARGEARSGVPRHRSRAGSNRRLTAAPSTRPDDREALQLARRGANYTSSVEFETRAIHAGQEPDPTTGALTVPIYQTSTYLQDAVGENKGYDYSRASNPTRSALEACLASLEGAEHGVAFASGLAATTTLMHLISPGDRVVPVNDAYGGAYRMFSQGYEPKGYVFQWVPADQISTNLASHLDERTRIVWLETPTNPLLNVIDIRAAAEAAHEADALVVADNTFASPYLQQPLSLGADVVLRSEERRVGKECRSR